MIEPVEYNYFDWDSIGHMNLNIIVGADEIDSSKNKAPIEVATASVAKDISPQGILKEKIPDANTDFIFAVAGEELGFIFCLIIIFIILSIIIRSLLKVLQLEDPYKIIAISGLICSFGLQCLINIFSSLGLIPTKGMTLPFVSYGGSSMISIAILFGFLLSLTNKKNEEL